jgi:hypothetical protein
MDPIMEVVREIVLARGNVDDDAFTLWLDTRYEGDDYAAYTALIAPIVTRIEDEVLAEIGEER